MFGAGLLALNLFGNKLIDPLAGLLKTIKTGSIGTTITDTYNAIKEELEPAFENIKTGIKNFIENTQFILSLIMNIGKTVSDFIAKYDVRGTEGPAGQQLPDGMLDEGERKAMIEDLTKGLTEAITKFTDNIIQNLILGFSIYTIGSMALRSLMGAAVTDTAFATAGGIFSVAAASVIIAAGIFKLADNVMTAYEDAVTDEFGKPQKFNYKEFFTRLIVGRDTGSTIGNVLQNSFDKALIGGAIGTAIAPGIGTAVGALAGLVIGGFSAYMGDEKVGSMIEDHFGETSILGQTIDLLYDTYELLILKPFEFIFGKLGVANDSLFTKLGFFGIEPGKERKVYTDEELYGENVNPDKLAMKSTNELLQIKKDNETQKLNLEKTKPITIMGRDFFPFGEFLDTRDSRKVLATLDAAIVTGKH